MLSGFALNEWQKGWWIGWCLGMVYFWISIIGWLIMAWLDIYTVTFSKRNDILLKNIFFIGVIILKIWILFLILYHFLSLKRTHGLLQIIHILSVDLQAHVFIDLLNHILIHFLIQDLAFLKIFLDHCLSLILINILILNFILTQVKVCTWLSDLFIRRNTSILN